MDDINEAYQIKKNTIEQLDRYSSVQVDPQDVEDVPISCIPFIEFSKKKTLIMANKDQNKSNSKEI